uniref:Uncharacterized protein n=1 Tax=Rhizophora mucronata TaxID=61149 RepID=A0A2P2PHE2_RHIMU
MAKAWLIKKTKELYIERLKTSYWYIVSKVLSISLVKYRSIPNF